MLWLIFAHFHSVSFGCRPFFVLYTYILSFFLLVFLLVGGHNCKWLISFHEACLSNYSFLSRAFVGYKSLFAISAADASDAVKWRTGRFFLFNFISFFFCILFIASVPRLSLYEVRQAKRKQTNCFRRQRRC